MPNLQKIIKVTQAQYDTLAAGGTVGSYTGLNDNYLYLVPKEGQTPTMIFLTYAQLKALRDNSQLISGHQYRITDYQCTTLTSNTSSAGHQFDIIVTADSTNELNEKARAALHSGDTYFANNKLEAWQLWYCLDNDTTKFVWADGTNGKGVVYRMIDEFGNDVPYDFKNVLFTKANTYTNAYTFSYTESSVIKDASISGLNKSCYSNIMKKYITVKKQVLNFIVFYSTSTTFNCYGNTFGNSCSNNTIGNNFYYNTIGNNFYYNTIGGYCDYNTIGNNCQHNTFGDSCSNNAIGNSCSNNTIGSSCQHSTFGNSCSDNTFGSNCQHNAIGNSCSNNTIGSYFYGNTIGNNFYYNTIGNNFYYNTIGNLFYYNTIGTSASANVYARYCKFDDGVQFISLTSNDTSATSSNYLQNVHVHSGVMGTSSSRKTISVPDRNLSYSIDYYANNSQTIFLD